MEKVFIVKGLISPEEYLKNLIDCIDENGELNIAREIDDVAFSTAESEETATHTEKVKLDAKLADYDLLYAFYCAALGDLKTFIEKYKPECKDHYYCKRMVTFAKRIDKLIELKAPEMILKNEKCLFADSILLYKTHAVGELIENGARYEKEKFTRRIVSNNPF